MSKVVQLVVLCISLSFASIAFGSSSAPNDLLYFLHVASDASWETEVGIINLGDTQVQGTLTAYSNAGVLVENRAITLAAGGKVSIIVGEEFHNAATINYLKFIADKGLCSGYEKFYKNGRRVAVPAVSQLNTGDLYVSHIASNSTWWTGLTLLNTNITAKNMMITFSDSSAYPLTLSAGQHWAGTIASSFPGLNVETVQSAVISNASGVLGLELFGSKTDTDNQYLSGVILSDESATSLFYPHIASNDQWWTGIIAYNPNDTSVTMTISPYSSAGTPLAASTVDIAPGGKYISTATELSLPQETHWFKVVASAPITGFELFGTKDGNQLAGYSTVNIDTRSGTFVKVEEHGWTGIAFVNIESTPATVTLSAVDDTGVTIATNTFDVAGNSKQIASVENFFTTNITGATYIKFTSDHDVVSFQLNGSLNGLMLDGLPSLSRLPANSPSPEGINSIEQELDRVLAKIVTDTDFSFYIEGNQGSAYLFNRGRSTLNTSYKSASTAKWVTAVIILRLVDQGYLSLTNKPQDFINNWPISKDDSLYGITLAHLLSFTSGLANNNNCINFGISDFATCVNKIGQDNKGSGRVPGSEFYYGNSHLQVAGLMAIKARGFNDWQEIFAEFQNQTGLFTNSQYDLPSTTNPRLAGGMHWTGNDYLAFIRAFKNGSLLSSELQMKTEHDQIASASIGYSPAIEGLNEDWHYGYGLWIECSANPYNCSEVTLLSCPGAYGAYPFMNRQDNYFGIIARQGNLGTFPRGKEIFNSVADLIKKWGLCN